jgi:tetratricopeptide (TPR) repeat protein
VLPAALIAAALSLSARALPPDGEALVFKGLDAMYSFDFEHAQAAFDELAEKYPEHPAGPFFQSGQYWVQFSQNADLPGTGPSLEPNFNKYMDEAIDRAKHLLKKNSKDAEAEFFLGSAYGMRGRWQILKRQWLRSALNGYKGYKHLHACLEDDPAFYDANLGLGMYDYYADKLPKVLKLASIVVAPGDAARGLQEVQQAIDKGHFSVTEAKLFLVALYTGYEHTPAKAFPIIEELRREKPENPFFAFMEVIARIDDKDWMGAIAFGEMLQPRFHEVSYAKAQSSLFDLYLASAYIGNKDYEKALDVLNRCIEAAPDARKAAVSYCHLRRAQVEDMLGRRDKAMDDYRTVTKREDYWDSQEKARGGMKHPATYETVVQQLLE